MGKIRKPRKTDLVSTTEQQTEIVAQPCADEQVVCSPTEEQNTQTPTRQQVEQTVTQLEGDIVLAPRKRIWEIDFIRGFMILFVVWDHLMYDLLYMGGSVYQTAFFQWLSGIASNYHSGAPGSLREVTHDTFVTLFVFTSGVSCSFSKSNGKRAIKMMCFAVLLSAVTFAVSEIIKDNITINFNVIHVVALSVFLWSCLEWIVSKFTKDWQHNLYGWIMLAGIITILIVGYKAKAEPWVNENKTWFFLAKHSGSVPGFHSFWGGDYLPFFPDFGWFLVGAFLGKKLYKERTTLFPTFNPKWVSPFTFCGRYSIWVYFVSQVVMAGFFLLFHSVWDIL